MDLGAFESALRRDGYDEIETKSMKPGMTVPDHTHPFDARALVLDGEISVTWQGQTKTCRQGDVFTMAAGVTHSEQLGPDGVRFLVGRRRQA